MGAMRTRWEVASYFAFIDLHFLLRQAPISLTIARNGSGACVQRRPWPPCTYAPVELVVLPCRLVGNQNSYQLELKTRRVHLAACTATLGDECMKQVARNLTDPFDGFLKDCKYILMDRDANFSSGFRSILQNAGAEPVRLPAKSPNLNSYLERFHLSIKAECLSRMIFFGEKSVRRAVSTYLVHYHGARNHQGLDNQLIDPGDEVGRKEGDILCREQLGGMLNYYYRKAA